VDSEPPGRGRAGLTPHLTTAEREAKGKQARAAVPRSAHGALRDEPDRADPVALLEEQAATRVSELVPIRYGRMLASPFAFFRGAALIMASDLAAAPHSGLTVQLCGDAHLSNFGVFGSPERRLVFDINDFDETLPGPFEWDVKRLAASLAVAARERGFAPEEGRTIVLEAVRQYREAMRQFAEMRNLEVWYAGMDVEELLATHAEGLDPKRVAKVERSLAKARTRDSMHAFSRLAQLVDGEPRIVSDPPLIIPIEELVPEGPDRETYVALLRARMRTYRRSLQSDRRTLLEQYRIVHLAFKVVGVGSVGTRAWIVLLLGRDGEDPLFLQLKEAQPSVLERFLGRSAYANAGQRVVAGQRLMQAASDIFLGWEHGTGLDGVERDFYVRQLRDWKASAEIEDMRPVGMARYGRMCGWTLARAHARSGDRVAIAAYLGRGDTFEQALAGFADRYADRNERDFAALERAARDGRVGAERGR
jgi:hypothetical protein